MIPDPPWINGPPDQDDRYTLTCNGCGEQRTGSIDNPDPPMIHSPGLEITACDDACFMVAVREDGTVRRAKWDDGVPYEP